ncbi:hypothetical protein CXR04_30180 [Streptomyces sp. CMB-StM0423]|nr:hypothetical protein CXR04_30180 [Streptomyces sp. CMB-StM0423]
MWQPGSVPSSQSRWRAAFRTSARSGRFRWSGIPTRIYDALLLFLTVLAATQQLLVRGTLLAAFLGVRICARRFVRRRERPFIPRQAGEGRRR